MRVFLKLIVAPQSVCTLMKHAKDAVLCHQHEVVAGSVQEGVSFTVDQTRGILTYVASNCPGRFHDEVEYVTVGGKFLQGAKLRQKGATLVQRLVGLGYLQVCGEADVWGDGVVPLPAVHLEGGLLDLKIILACTILPLSRGHLHDCSLYVQLSWKHASYSSIDR